jgi:hypothetical protein
MHVQYLSTWLPSVLPFVLKLDGSLLINQCHQAQVKKTYRGDNAKAVA